MKNNKYYQIYKINKVTYKPFDYWKGKNELFPELCYCGHVKNEHNDDNKCTRQEFCNCLGFSP
jgi:hypothetical protein